MAEVKTLCLQFHLLAFLAMHLAGVTASAGLKQIHCHPLKVLVFPHSAYDFVMELQDAATRC